MGARVGNGEAARAGSGGSYRVPLMSMGRLPNVSMLGREGVGDSINKGINISTGFGLWFPCFLLLCGKIGVVP